jgi:dihydrofolate reductase
VPLEPEGDAFYPAWDPAQWVEADRERFDGFERVWLERVDRT